MKTKLLFVAALFLATGSFAQEVTAKSDQATSATTQSGNAGSSGNAGISSSSNATVKTSAVDKATKKANQSKQKAKKAVIKQKEAVSGQAHADVMTTQKTVKENSTGSGSVQSESRISAESKSNKVSQNASLNNKANVSAESVKSTGNEAKKDSKMGNETVKTDVKNSSDNAIRTGTGIASKTKPKPATFRMQTQLKGNARLKIK
jgi:hypothetical protein